MSQGKCCLKLHIEDQSMHTTFHMAQKGQASVDMILGRSWMAQTHCLIDWSSQSSTLCINSTNLTCFSANTPSTTLDNSSKGIDESNHPITKTTTMVWIQDEKNHDFGWQVPKALLSTQKQGRKSHHKASYWLPRASYKKMPPKPQQAKA